MRIMQMQQHWYPSYIYLHSISHGGIMTHYSYNAVTWVDANKIVVKSCSKMQQKCNKNTRVEIAIPLIYASISHQHSWCIIRFVG